MAKQKQKPKAKPRGRAKTPEARFSSFLKMLEITGKISVAARHAVIANDVLFRRKRNDHDFAKKIQQATQKRFVKLNELLVSKFGEATITELLKILGQCYAQHYDKDRNKIPIRLVYRVVNGLVMEAMNSVEPEKRASCLQGMEGIISQLEMADASGGVGKLHNAIIPPQKDNSVQEDADSDSDGDEN
mgnify:CR=1 FL=1